MKRLNSPLSHLLVALGFAVVCQAMATPAAPGLSPQSTVLRTEAYASSPAAYSLPPDVPAEMAQIAEPQPLMGTLRTAFDLSAGGSQLRVRLSNEANDEPLAVGAVSVALGKPLSSDPGAQPVPVTFGGESGVVIPAGAPVLSDPVTLATKPLDRLVVSVYTPDGPRGVALGGKGMALAPGNQTDKITLEGDRTVVARSPVSGITVEGGSALPVIVALGDSITDGSRPAAEQMAGYPSVLMRRFNDLPEQERRSVINAGIGGNRLLTSGWGDNVLSRLDRDVLRVAKVSHVILLVGINDIGLGGPPLTMLEASASAEQLIAGYQQVITRAHTRGIKVIGATLLPFKGAFYYTEAKDRERLAVNEWIRESGTFDGVLDFDVVTRDPADHLRLNPAFDSGDHLHPSDAGYRAMGESIDLSIFAH